MPPSPAVVLERQKRRAFIMPKMPQEYLDYHRQYQRDYIAAHPERRLKWQITAAVKLLKRNGWQLIPPAVSEEV